MERLTEKIGNTNCVKGCEHISKVFQHTISVDVVLTFSTYFSRHIISFLKRALIRISK